MAAEPEAAVVTKDSILEHLKGIGVEGQTIDHAPAMTVEEQAGLLPKGQAVTLTKNLLLLDKKKRYILLTAVHDTPVDLRNLSIRLGLGKNGIRFAPQEDIPKRLKVPLGSVTPLALINGAAKNVVFFIDSRIKSCPLISAHPLTNEATTLLKPAELEAFLESLGRQATYVDMTVVPEVGPSYVPDLESLLPADESSTKGAADEEAGGGGKKKPATAKDSSENKSKAAGAFGTAASSFPLQQTGPALDDISLTSSRVLQSLTKFLKKEESSSGAQVDVNALAAKLEGSLSADIEFILTMFKSAAYANGFSAGRASRALHG